MPKIMISVHAVFENEVPGFVVWMYAVAYGVCGLDVCSWIREQFSRGEQGSHTFRLIQVRVMGTLGFHRLFSSRGK